MSVSSSEVSRLRASSGLSPSRGAVSGSDEASEGSGGAAARSRTIRSTRFRSKGLPR